MKPLEIGYFFNRLLETLCLWCHQSIFIVSFVPLLSLSDKVQFLLTWLRLSKRYVPVHVPRPISSQAEMRSPKSYLSLPNRTQPFEALLLYLRAQKAGNGSRSRPWNQALSMGYWIPKWHPGTAITLYQIPTPLQSLFCSGRYSPWGNKYLN